MELEEAKTLITNFTIKFAKDNFNRDIKVYFGYTIRRWGICTPSKNIIEYSVNFIEANKNNIKALEALAIHECCHLKALGHGWNFKSVCRTYGLEENHTQKLAIGVVAPQPKQYYLWKCPKCGLEFKKQKYSEKIQACGTCCKLYSNNKFDKRFQFVFVKYVDEEADKMREMEQKLKQGKKID